MIERRRRWKYYILKSLRLTIRKMRSSEAKIAEAVTKEDRKLVRDCPLLSAARPPELKIASRLALLGGGASMLERQRRMAEDSSLWACRIGHDGDLPF